MKQQLILNMKVLLLALLLLGVVASVTTIEELEIELLQEKVKLMKEKLRLLEQMKEGGGDQ